MNELNLNGRHPNDLPDKKTINEILLELRDTKKFDINLRNLQLRVNDGSLYRKWYADNKPFSEWVEQGEVRTSEIDYSSMRFNLDLDNLTEWATPSFLSIKETRYHIVRYPMRLTVKLKDDVLALNKYLFIPRAMKEICETSNEVYLRLKDYLGQDVIQDQFNIMNFTIDLMISRCKII
jgi:hypothetical protein